MTQYTPRALAAYKALGAFTCFFALIIPSVLNQYSPPDSKVAVIVFMWVIAGIMLFLGIMLGLGPEEKQA